MNLFGKAKKKGKSGGTKDSIQNLKGTLSMLEKREVLLQKKIDNELAIAKKNATKNKKAALMALKRKKTYEAQMEKIGGSRMTIESQIMAIEGASVSLETMNAMKQGAAAMKGIHKGMTIDKVDETMDEIRDQMDLAEEINSAISQPTGFGMEFDEDELLGELDELDELSLEDEVGITDELPATSNLVDLPNAPVNTPAGVTKEEEDELEELKAAFA